MYLYVAIMNITMVSDLNIMVLSNMCSILSSGFDWVCKYARNRMKKIFIIIYEWLNCMVMIETTMV